eukprot:PhM_4_TR2219/c0_g1_i1/m.22625/K11652/ACTL6B; actin-like protein 6B
MSHSTTPVSGGCSNSGGYITRDALHLCLVADLGSFETRLGYSIETTPRCITRSVFAHTATATAALRHGIEELSCALPSGEYYMQNATDSAEHMVAVLDSLAEKRFRPDRGLPLVVAPSPGKCESDAERAQLVRALFEKGSFDVVHIARPSVCAAFAAGTPTAVVLDSGHTHTTCQAVFEGYALTQSTVKHDVGGLQVSSVARQLFPESATLTPPWLSPSASPEQMFYWQSHTVHDLKAHVLEVLEKRPVVPLSRDVLDKRVEFVLPDGHALHLGFERSYLVESLFNPNFAAFRRDMHRAHSFDEHKSLAVDVIMSDGTIMGFPQMVEATLNKCDVETRAALTTLVAAGGNLQMKGAMARLKSEVAGLVGTCTSPAHGSSSVWVGAAMMASVPSFQQLFYSRAEYNEYGAEQLLALRSP